MQTARSGAPFGETARTFFPHVEGLRGVAALYVFLYHVWQTGIAHAGATLGVLLPITRPWLQYGHFAVAVFIVISGYCLGLPVARRLDRPFDVVRFAKRRARRLGPAYLLALLLSPVPFLVAAHLNGKSVPLWHVGVALAAHLALVHNWIPALAEYLNGPMWSIALECQIYIVFALLLVPVWRRFGPGALLAVALVLGLAPHFALGGRVDFTIWWLLALFGMGVVAAHASAHRWMQGNAWRWVALAAAAVAVVAVIPEGDAVPDGSLWPADLAVGVAVALLFVTAGGARLPWTARFLALTPLVALGTFSYSLYLVHGPLVIVTGAALAHVHAGPEASALAYLALIPAVIAVAWAFSLAAERPFLSPEFRASLEAGEASPAEPVAAPLEASAPAYEPT